MASMEEALLDCDDVAALDPLDENAVVSFIGARYRAYRMSKRPGLALLERTDGCLDVRFACPPACRCRQSASR